MVLRLGFTAGGKVPAVGPAVEVQSHRLECAGRTGSMAVTWHLNDHISLLVFQNF